MGSCPAHSIHNKHLTLKTILTSIKLQLSNIRLIILNNSIQSQHVGNPQKQIITLKHQLVRIKENKNILYFYDMLRNNPSICI